MLLYNSNFTHPHSHTGSEIQSPLVTPVLKQVILLPANSINKSVFLPIDNENLRRE